MQDRTPIEPDGLISISYPDITEWCERLGCSEVQLAEAIGAVGYCAARVAEYLARQASQGPPGLPSPDGSAPD